MLANLNPGVMSSWCASAEEVSSVLGFFFFSLLRALLSLSESDPTLIITELLMKTLPADTASLRAGLQHMSSEDTEFNPQHGF